MRRERPPTNSRRGFARALRRACALALVAVVATATHAREDASRAIAGPGPLHVPSPDWRDQVIYFVMLDRFDDGDASNNDQGAGEYDPADGRRYSGGDLAGVARRIDYIRGLGATAVWITPPVANQWWDARVQYGGYHGYWAEHFKATDAHVGTLDDYRSLSRALHGAGMYLVQDVVLNHTGNFFSYEALPPPTKPARGYRHAGTQRGRHAPSQAPFDRNDPRRRADREAAIYHWTPRIVDYADPAQERRWQLADLDDLATENPRVRAALRDAYGYWIREAGVDAMRVDTAFYVEPDLFRDFLLADDADAPGLHAVARATGRDDFLVFGEGFGLDRPYQDAMARKIDAYMREATPDARLSMINFPLYGTTGDVFARGHPTAELRHRIESAWSLHADPRRMPTFVDNHDVARFLAGGSVDALRQALMMIMTLPGIPVIYYGTEQGFTAQRGAMFARGNESGGVDHFDASAPLYRWIAALTTLRREQRVFSRGTPAVIAASEAGAGVFAYRVHGDDGDAIVAFNTSETPRLLDARVDGRGGERYRFVRAIDGAFDDLSLAGDGSFVVELPPRAGVAWVAAEGPAVPRAAAPVRLELSPAMVAPRGGGARFGGRVLEPLPPQPDDARRVAHHEPVLSRDVGELKLVVDGDLATAQPLRADAQGFVVGTVDTRAMLDPRATHRAVLWSPTLGIVSAAQDFRARPNWKLAGEIADPAGDDAGPRGRYRYPADPGWAKQRPADLRLARAEVADGALRLTLTMGSLAQTWNPPHGFDHVAFTIYLSLPGRDGGAAELPLQHAAMPRGARWHYRIRAHGWTHALHAADGADATHEGRAIAPAARIDADAGARTVTFTLAATALADARGRAPDWHGARIYVTTWDYDGEYRALTRAGGPMAFGGGDGTRDPLVMDELELVLK